MTLDDYILQHTSPEPDYLYRLWRATNLQTVHGRMASGHLQGRLLKMLVQMIRPRNILEVATANGADNLVLGAFGCGAFNNPPDLVAGCFRYYLVDKGYRNYFKRIMKDAKRQKRYNKALQKLMEKQS